MLTSRTEWKKRSIIDQHFLLKIDILHLLRGLVFHPRLSSVFVFFFTLLCPKPSSYIQFTGLSSCCQRNMAYISPHRSGVCQSRTIKFDSVTHSPFLFIVLVIIAKTQVILYLWFLIRTWNLLPLLCFQVLPGWCAVVSLPLWNRALWSLLERYLVHIYCCSLFSH